MLKTYTLQMTFTVTAHDTALATLPETITAVERAMNKWGITEDGEWSRLDGWTFGVKP